MQHAESVREKLFTMRMSSEEWARVEALAEHYGLNAAGLIRMLLKEKARDVGVDVAAAPSKRAPAPTKKR
jgi:hypothetical protein